ASPIKRICLRSICSAGLIFRSPQTCERRPCSLNCSDAVMPDLPALRDARTSSTLLPILETIPIPVITTRFIMTFL
ncbi:hypothetical protein D047_0193B, partial [Vibrio parahaemolyticus VPTS-2010_2]